MGKIGEKVPFQAAIKFKFSLLGIFTYNPFKSCLFPKGLKYQKGPYTFARLSIRLSSVLIKGMCSFKAWAMFESFTSLLPDAINHLMNKLLPWFLKSLLTLWLNLVIWAFTFEVLNSGECPIAFY